MDYYKDPTGGNETDGTQEANTPSAKEKTFTQNEVNQIISERLGKEKTRLLAQLEEEKQRLKRQEFMLEAKDRMRQAGHPEHLVAILNTENPEKFEESMNLLTAYTEHIRQGVAGEFIRLSEAPKTGDGTGRAEDILRKAMGLD